MGHCQGPDMLLRRSCWGWFLPKQRQAFSIIVGVLVAAAACSGRASRSTEGSDGGRPDVTSPADLVLADLQVHADAGQAADSFIETNRGAETQATADARSISDSADAVSDAGAKPEAPIDSTRGTEAGSEVGQRGDTGADVGRDADAQVTGDVGPEVSEVGSGTGTDADPCAGGTTYSDSTSGGATLDSYGWVRLAVGSSNKIVAFDTTMVVPETPPASGTLFLWPGLQPVSGGANYAVLDNGVLQPVLTWGPTCAPNAPDQSYQSWWISGQYVNTNISSSSANYTAYHDCHGGLGMNVAVGDTLDMRFALSGSDWTQTVTNRRNSQSVSYTIDMLGQAQGSAEFVIEEYSSKPLSDVIFTSSVITFDSAAKSACQAIQRGTNDYFSAPRASTDGLRCCVGKITLRAQGVTASTPNSP